MYYPRWKIALYAIPILIGIFLALPNLVPRHHLDALPDWLPKKQVSLGLDLRGGSHLLLEIDSAALIKTRLEGLAETVHQALREAKIPAAEPTLADGAVVTTVQDSSRTDDAAAVIRRLAASLSDGAADGPDVQVTTTAGKVSVKPIDRVVGSWTSAALDQSLEIVRRRVDETGVVEPTIVRQGSDRLGSVRS